MTTVSKENELKIDIGVNSTTDQKISGRRSRKSKNEIENLPKSRNKLSSSSSSSSNPNNSTKNNHNNNKKISNIKVPKSKTRTKKHLKNNDWSTSFDDTITNQDKFQFKNNSSNFKKIPLDNNSRKVPIIMINQSIQTDPPLSKQIDSFFNTPIKSNKLSLNSLTIKQKFSNINDWNDSFDIVTPIKERRWSGETIYSANSSLLSPLNSPRNSIIETTIMTNTTNTSIMLVNDKTTNKDNLVNENISQLTKYRSRFDSEPLFETRLNSIIELLSAIGSSDNITTITPTNNCPKNIMRWNDVPDCCQT